MIINGMLILTAFLMGTVLGLVLGSTITVFLLYFKSMKRRIEFMGWLFRHRKKFMESWEEDEGKN